MSKLTEFELENRRKVTDQVFAALETSNIPMTKRYVIWLALQSSACVIVGPEINESLYNHRLLIPVSTVTAHLQAPGWMHLGRKKELTPSVWPRRKNFEVCQAIEYYVRNIDEKPLFNTGGELLLGAVGESTLRDFKLWKLRWLPYHRLMTRTFNSKIEWFEAGIKTPRKFLAAID